MRYNLVKRWLVYFIGLVILSLGVALTIKGRLLGLGSWDVLHYGLYKTFGLTVGSWAIIVGIIIVVISSIALKQLPKLGVYVNMFTIGIFIDIFSFLLPDVEGYVMHTIMFIIGVLILAFGIALYLTPNVGAGPRDTLMLVLVEKFNLKVSTARNVMELFAALLGYFFGGPVFIGTVVIILSLGKLIELFLPTARKMLVWFLGGEDPHILNI